MRDAAALAGIMDETAEIHALRSRVAADPDDCRSLVLYCWRVTAHRIAAAETADATLVRLREIVEEARGIGRLAARRWAERMAAEMERVSEWVNATLPAFLAECRRLGTMPHATLCDAVRSLKAEMEPEEFAAMYERMSLAAVIANAQAETPDRTRLNDLRLQAFGGSPDARTLLLTLTAIGEYSDALGAEADLIEATGIGGNAAFFALALEWFDTIRPEIHEIGAMLDEIGLAGQKAAVVGLRGELSPVEFDRLRKHCGDAIMAAV